MTRLCAYFFYSRLQFCFSSFRCLVIALLAGSAAQADSLRDIYELALKNDPVLRGAEATYRANLESETQARAQLLPQLNAEGSYGNSHRHQDYEVVNIANELRDTRQNTHLRSGSWNVELQQPIFDLSAWFSFRSGKSTSEQAQAQFAFDQQDLIVRVAEAYFEVLRQADNVEAARAEEIATEEQMNQAQERFNAGLTGIADAQQARASCKASMAQRMTDEGNLASAQEALTILTGTDHSDLSTLKADFPVINPSPVDRAEWVQFALASNFALKAAIAAMQAADANATSRSMAHMPRITGSLSYQEDNVSGNQETSPPAPFATGPDSEGDTTAAMLRVTVPIFSSGYTSSQTRQAHAQYSAALEKKIETERTIIHQTRAKHIAASTDVQRVHAQQEAIEAAQIALDATRAGYKAGTRSIVDVLVSQRALFEARRDHANARYDYVMDMLNLKALAGTLSPKDVDELDVWLVKPHLRSATGGH